MPSSSLEFLALREAAAGCDVSEIVRSMYREQRDHELTTFGATYLKYRKVVAEWMVDVCEYFSLHSTTTHAAIAYLDRLQPNEKFSRFEWQMLAICCILIASKYNECEDHVPDLSTLEEITQQSIPNETVLNYELWALKRMGWKLNARTPMAFLSSYMVLGTVLPSDEHSGDSERGEVEERVKAQLQVLANKCTLDVRFKGFKASDVAGAILYCTRRQMGVKPVWRPELTQMTMTDPTVDGGVVSEIAALIEASQSEAIMPPAPPSSASKKDQLLVGEATSSSSSAAMFSTPTQVRNSSSSCSSGDSSPEDNLLSIVDAVTALTEKVKISKASPTTVTLSEEDEGSDFDDLRASLSSSA